MIFNQRPSEVIRLTKERLYHYGQTVKQENWQSVKSPDNTMEILNHSIAFPMPHWSNELRDEVVPNLPWADEHFEERIGGIPLNPPPSSEHWPFNPKPYNPGHLPGGKFSHTYPERFWPKYTKGIEPDKGIRYSYGDLNDVIALLRKDPTTRQAYLPVWGFEDTGATQGQRVPCTLGYHFIVRNNMIHIIYFIRSCDIIRHFRDDIYLACKLAQHVKWEAFGNDVTLGSFTMHITSLHCFEKEKGLLLVKKT